MPNWPAKPDFGQVLAREGYPHGAACDELLEADTATPETTIGPVNLNVKAMTLMYGWMMPRKFGRPDEPDVFGKPQ